MWAITRKQKIMIGWVTWSIVGVLLFTYHRLFTIATTGDQTFMVLEPQKSVRMRVYSLYGHELEFDMAFSHVPGDNRMAELGDSTTSSLPGESPIFENLGKRIVCTVSVNGGPPATLEALPADASGESAIYRSLSRDRPGPDRRWHRPQDVLPMTVSRGWNNIVVTISDVDPSLAGERVVLETPPPLTFMASWASYEWLWPGFLIFPLVYPIYAGIGLIMAGWTWRVARA